MNPQEPYLPSSTLPPDPPAPVPPPPRGPSSFERGMARFTDEMLRERRADRRWRVFFRLAWLILFIIIAWALFVGRGHGGAPSGPHTALVDVRGERGKLGRRPEGRVRGRRVAGRRAAHQQPGRQPGAGGHRQRRDPALEG